MHALELKIPPLVAWLICIAGMWTFSRLFPGAGFSLPHALLASTAIAIFGITTALAGVREFRRQRTTVHPTRPHEATAIVTRGVYRWTRNPMYVGLAACLIAFGVYQGNVAALAWIMVFVAYMTRFQIKPEERALTAKFGSDYLDYQSTVRRWL